MLLIQFSAGQGPEECALATSLAYQYFVKEALVLAYKVDVLEHLNSRYNNNYKSILCRVSCPKDKLTDLKDFLLSWQGSVKWVCQSPYRPKHRRKNWFIDVSFWQQADEVELSSSEFQIKTCRSSGAGGQHVNTTDSAVQVTHIKTGLSVKMSAERSQHQNKKLAMALIFHKLKCQHNEIASEEKSLRRLQHHQLERGDAKRCFIGLKFKAK